MADGCQACPQGTGGWQGVYFWAQWIVYSRPHGQQTVSGSVDSAGWLDGKGRDEYVKPIGSILLNPLDIIIFLDNINLLLSGFILNYIA